MCVELYGSPECVEPLRCMWNPQSVTERADLCHSGGVAPQPLQLHLGLPLAVLRPFLLCLAGLKPLPVAVSSNRVQTQSHIMYYLVHILV